jgi:uncharacterized protein
MPAIGPDFREGLSRTLYDGTFGLGPYKTFFLFVVLAAVQLLLPVILQALYLATNPILLAAIIEGVRSKGGIALTPEELITLSMFTFAALTPVSLLSIWLSRKFSALDGGNARIALASHWPKIGWLGWFAILFGFVVVVGSAAGLLRWATGDTKVGDVEQMAAMLRDTPWAKVILPLAIVAFVPIAEEHIFRGFLLGRMKSTRLGVVGATILSSVLFAAMHGATQSPVALVQLFVMSIALSFVFLRFGSLWVPIVCHAVWNCLSMLVLFNAPLAVPT